MTIRAVAPFVLLVALGSGTARGASIVEISTPVGSNDAVSHSFDDGVWDVSATTTHGLDTSLGIGFTINTFYPGPMGTVPPDVVKHDHPSFGGGQDTGWVGTTPSASRARITYTFDHPAIVDQLLILEHTNGVAQVEGFAGNDLATLYDPSNAIGTTIGSAGVGPFVDGSGNTDYLPSLFTFNISRADRYFGFVVAQTSFNLGYAFYRAFPELNGVAYGASGPLPLPEPTSLALGGLALGALALRRARRA